MRDHRPIPPSESERLPPYDKISRKQRLEWRNQHPQTYKLLWLTSIHVPDATDGLPHPLIVASGITDNPEYYSDGGLRPCNHFAVFHYALQGAGVFRSGETEYPVSAGQGFLFEANDPSITYWYPRGTNTPWRFVWISFAGGQILPWVRELRRQRGPLFTLPEKHPFISRLLSYARFGFSVSELHSLEALQWVMELLLALTNTPMTDGVRGRTAHLVSQATCFINANIEAPLRVSTIARKLDVSREHLSRAFLSELGVGPQAFIVQQKLHLACSMLRETNLETKQIAARLGFGSATSFCRAFRRTIGMSPVIFRCRG